MKVLWAEPNADSLTTERKFAVGYWPTVVPWKHCVELLIFAFSA